MRRIAAIKTKRKIKNHSKRTSPLYLHLNIRYINNTPIWKRLKSSCHPLLLFGLFTAIQAMQQYRESPMENVAAENQMIAFKQDSKSNFFSHFSIYFS